MTSPEVPPRTGPRRAFPGLGRRLACAGALCAWLGTAQAQNPFAPGLRWVRSSTAQDAWIPRSVALGGDENEVWVAASAGSKHVELLALAGSGAQAPILRDDSYANALGVVSVSAGSDVRAFFALAQEANPDAQHRRTHLDRHDPVQALQQGGNARVWSHDFGFLTNGAARIACDQGGTRVVGAVWDSVTHEVQVDLLDAANGALLYRTRVPALALDEIALDATGAHLALAAGLDLWVLDAQGASVHHEVLATSTHALALSGDGTLLALGGSGMLRLFAEQAGGSFAQRLGLPVPSPGELAARCALSADGRTLAVGWWNAASGTAVRLQLLDTLAGQLLWEKYQPGFVGGPQNLPEAVVASADGERAAFGLWGDGTSEPELLLVARNAAVPLLAVDLPGSVQGLALDAHGQRLVVTHKDVHANSFGSNGSVRLYETGERDLVLGSRAAPGGSFELAARRSGASFVFFLAGPRSAQPQVFPNTQGTLWLRRNALGVVPRAADAQGGADLSLPIPADPLLYGTEQHFQAAFRVNGVLCFGTSVLDALIL